MSRPGLSRLDFLIIMVLIFAAIGLVVPAVAKIKEAERRTQTNNNLKQCALAVQTFHDVYRRLPDAYNTGGIYVDKPVSFWFQLLPYVEADNVYAHGMIDAVVPAFHAPSDLSTMDVAGTVSFAANIRVFAYNALLRNDPGPNSTQKAIDVPGGILKANLTFPRIVDGTTNTLMLMTRYADCADRRTWYAADVLGQSSLGEMPSPGVGGFCGAGSSTTPPTADGPLTAMYQLTPSREQCLPAAAVFGHSFGIGGMSVAMCDASVKNISPTMTPLRFAGAVCPGDYPWTGSEWAED